MGPHPGLIVCVSAALCGQLPHCQFAKQGAPHLISGRANQSGMLNWGAGPAYAHASARRQRGRGGGGAVGPIQFPAWCRHEACITVTVATCIVIPKLADTTEGVAQLPVCGAGVEDGRRQVVALAPLGS